MGKSQRVRGVIQAKGTASLYYIFIGCSVRFDWIFPQKRHCMLAVCKEVTNKWNLRKSKCIFLVSKYRVY